MKEENFRCWPISQLVHLHINAIELASLEDELLQHRRQKLIAVGAVPIGVSKVRVSAKAKRRH